ncbi:hypothetical protein SteCoe_11004 [Stentor coeruleus]|uniref:DNA polymerase kappa n=1 Tax=Stentor coeruleus TaxID=5963 RepID=A0A1R2CE77_9CILI|nr:hypothetical protein SteCoe_11004 [Stentor coeruleus]
MSKEHKDNENKGLLCNFTHEKAGMQGLDREKINKIIHDTSVNTEFFKREQEHIAIVEEKARSMKNRISESLSKGPDFIREINEEIYKIIQEIESERHLSETWIHVDMDMFYASVEIRDNPELADKPVAVGGNSMIATANYIARRYGIRSAMPGFIGKKLCEELVFVKPNFSKYREEGEKIREIFRDFDPDFESMGLDEGNLRVTEYLINNEMNHDEGRQELARIIRQRIKDKTQLPASAGIACNRSLAKIATDMGKPNGQYFIPFDKEQIIEIMSKMNVRKIPGVGKVLEKTLNELGVVTCKDILQKKYELYIAFQAGSFKFLASAALGVGSCYHHETREEQKSISLSRTFASTNNIEEINKYIAEFSREISEQLDEKNAQIKTVSVSLKTYKFEPKSKSETLGRYIYKELDIYEIAIKLYNELAIKEKIRHVGVRVANIIYRRTGAIDDIIEKVSKDPTPKQSSIKCFSQQCPVCNKVFMYTEKRMEIHLKQCLEEQSQKFQPKVVKKQKNAPQPTITLDCFYKKK